MKRHWWVAVSVCHNYYHFHYYFDRPKYCAERVCMFVYLSVCSHMSKPTRPNFTEVSVHVTCGRHVMCTSGFVENCARENAHSEKCNDSASDGDDTR